MRLSLMVGLMMAAVAAVVAADAAETDDIGFGGFGGWDWLEAWFGDEALDAGSHALLEKRPTRWLVIYRNESPG
jgi:hypothetical protein